MCPRRASCPISCSRIVSFGIWNSRSKTATSRIPVSPKRVSTRRPRTAYGQHVGPQRHSPNTHYERDNRNCFHVGQLLFTEVDDSLRLDRPVTGAALRVEERQNLLKPFSVRHVPQERTLALNP